MNLDQIEGNLKKLLKNFNEEDFIFDLLLAYGIPKATVTLLKKGRHNLSKQEGIIILKRKLFFQWQTDEDIHATIDRLQKEALTHRHQPRFIIVTDYETLLATDTKTQEHLDIPIKELTKYYDFFLPWAGIEKHRNKGENPADRKAAEKMAKLYDEIMADNKIVEKGRICDLNSFLSRLLFCFFAEDTNIFKDRLFTDSVGSHTQSDGEDLHIYLEKLFEVLNTRDTQSYPAFFQKFPYVNGGLFERKHWIPKLSARARKIILECGDLDWSKINPDIFGSMMQAVVHPGERGSLGMHYTSVSNIMKVIEPLFLSELRAAFKKNIGNKKKLEELRFRISKIKFFDPACGSGNFLIITYKELRRLEMEIINELGAFSFSEIQLTQFYGIDIDDFAKEIAKLSLYLAEHQMNMEFQKQFGKSEPTLPLKTGGNIVCGNATRLNWENICSNDKDTELFIFGNPPYLGARNQNKAQKEDVQRTLKNLDGANSLDYIACWFFKASTYISKNSGAFAFVSTNSICQGEQVSLLWPSILSKNIEISFAHQSFKWANNAKRNAGVTCVIIGMRRCANKEKIIYSGNVAISVKNISPYLTNNHNIIVSRISKPINSLPPLVYGNQAIDGGHLILTSDEKNKILADYPFAQKYIRRLYGAEDFIKDLTRWCIWVPDKLYPAAKKIPPFKHRFEKVRGYRKEKGEVAKSLVHIPYRFRYTHTAKRNLLILPRTTSERREYIPIGLLDNTAIVTDAVQVIYDPEIYAMGVLSSKIHMVWVRAVAGRLKTDLRYSNSLCYNTFPIPLLSSRQKDNITRHVFNVLEQREKHPEKTMAQLYDPDKMPEGLKEAHHHLDLAVERCYRSKPFATDEERLEYLFKLYEQMIEEENQHTN